MRRYGIAPRTLDIQGQNISSQLAISRIVAEPEVIAEVVEDVVEPEPAEPCEGIEWIPGATVDISSLSGYAASSDQRVIALDHSTSPPSWIMVGYASSTPDDEIEYITFDENTSSTPTSNALFSTTHGSNEVIQGFAVGPSGNILVALEAPDGAGTIGVDLFNSSGSVLTNIDPPDSPTEDLKTAVGVDIAAKSDGTWVAAWSTFYNPSGTLNDEDRLYAHVQGDADAQELFTIDAEDDGDIVGVRVAVDPILNHYYVFYLINPAPAGSNQIWFIKWSGSSWDSPVELTSILDDGSITALDTQREDWTVDASNGVVVFSIRTLGPTHTGFYYSVDGGATWSSRIEVFDVVSGTEGDYAVDLRFSPDGENLAIVAINDDTHDEIYAFVYTRDDPLTSLTQTNVYQLSGIASDPESLSGAHDFYFEIADDGEIYAAWGTGSDIHQAACLPGPASSTSVATLVSTRETDYGDIIAYWPLTDASPTTDDGPNSLTLTGETNLQTQEGPFATQDHVAGDPSDVSALTIPTAFSNNGINGNSHGFTIMCWFYADSTTTESTRQFIQIMRSNDEYAIRLYLANDTTLTGFVRLRSTWPNVTVSGSTITQDQWNFACMRVNLQNDQVYLRVNDTVTESTETLPVDISIGVPVTVPNRLLSTHSGGGTQWHGGGLSHMIIVHSAMATDYIDAFASATAP